MHPLSILGKRSLPVFIAGTIASMVAQVMKFINPGGVAYDTVLIAAGIAMQFALAYYLEWLSGMEWAGKAAAPGGRQPVRPYAGTMPAATGS